MPSRVLVDPLASRKISRRPSVKPESAREYFSADESTHDSRPPAYGLAGLRMFAPGQGTVTAGRSPRTEMPFCSGTRTQAMPSQPISQGERGEEPAAPPIVHEVVRSAGQPLDPVNRKSFEGRLGQGLGDVRVHTGSRAAASARAVDSLAYTVGRQIVFGAGEYSPQTPRGRGLLAHELTHAAQQSSARTAGGQLKIGKQADRFEQEAESGAGQAPATRLATQRVQRVSLWQKFIRFIGFEGTFQDDELQQYLKFLDDQKRIEGHYDSDNKAREVVRRWKAGKKGYTLSLPRKVLLLKEMMTGYVSDGDEEGMLSILSGSSDSELRDILQQIPAKDMRAKIGGDNRVLYDFLIGQYTRRNSDPLTGTKAVTPTGHIVTEQALSPGAKLVDEPKKPEPKKEEAKKDEPKKDAANKDEGDKDEPPPKLQEAAAMTGISPDPAHNIPGDFEKAMVAAMKTQVHQFGETFRAKKKGLTEIPLATARPIAAVAQKSTEEYFGPLIQVASHAPSDTYHPGSYDVKPEIHSQEQVPISLNGGGGHPGRIGWMHYWMANQGDPVMQKFGCDTARSPDKEEFARVASVLASNPALQGDIDDAIHGWGGEASQGINLGLLYDTSKPENTRRARWDIYTGVLHEMMHVLQHPNYVRTYQLFTGTAKEILKEGMPDVMRRDLWDGPGQLRARLATSAYDNQRAEIEGGKYDYDENVVFYHPDYDEIKDARKIIEGDGKRKGVGMANARAAFFLGHTDLLGIGEGTRGAVADLGGIANYRANDARDADIVVAQPGDTLDTIRARSGASETGILNETTSKALRPDEAIAAGTRLKVPGIRYVSIIKEDTLGDIASQNRVDSDRIAVANGLPAGT